MTEMLFRGKILQKVFSPSGKGIVYENEKHEDWLKEADTVW